MKSRSLFDRLFIFFQRNYEIQINIDTKGFSRTIAL